MDKPNVGFIGLGVMGAGMAANLVRKGFPTRVFNRTAAKAAPLVAAGASIAEDLAGAARGADIVVTCLPATADVEQALFGDGGIASALAPGAVVADTSTIDARAAKGFAAQLSEMGAHFLDAPISGGQKGAVDGTLACMVGGSDEALAKARPVLEAFSATIVHAGGSGAGQVTKSCNQLCVAATFTALSEGMAMAKAMGVDPARIREALLGGSAKSTVVERHMKRFLDGDREPGFRSVLMEKDIRIALDAMRGLRVYSPLTAQIDQLFHALVASGRGEKDWITMADLIEDLSAGA